MTRLGFKRFVKYVTVGLSTFVFDLLLLFILVDFFEFDQVWSAGGAFLLAVSINYFLSRRFVFKGTLRNVREGYVSFIGIALVGLAIVTGGMYVLIVWGGVHYLVARILIAGVAGFWNYLMNLYVNFKVAGKHQ